MIIITYIYIYKTYIYIYMVNYFYIIAFFKIFLNICGNIMEKNNSLMYRSKIIVNWLRFANFLSTRVNYESRIVNAETFLKILRERSTIFTHAV